MLGIIVAFIVINVLLYFRKQLYTAIFFGLVLIVLFNPVTPRESVVLFIDSATSPIAVLLGLIILFFTGFGNLLKEMGSLTKMVEYLSRIIRDVRVQLAVLPALMGLMMFPGGAVFSAPLVEEAGKTVELHKDRLVVINVLFRHVAYLIFPLYTTLILIGELSSYSINRFILFNLPLFTLAIIILSFTLFRGIQQPPKKPADFSAIPALLYSLAPLLIVIILTMAFNIYLPMAIVTGILFALFQYPPNEPLPVTLKHRLSLFYKGINWHMTASIVSIIIFKDFLIESNAINALVDTLTTNGFPLYVLALIIPFLIGFITGNHSAAIGISAPLFLTAAPPAQAFHYLALTFVTGLDGYQGSPLHMCTVLTVQHFNASLTTAVRKINLYVIGLSILALINFAIFI
jgi:integral membrane protein (TIGR00529 family)